MMRNSDPYPVHDAIRSRRFPGQVAKGFQPRAQSASWLLKPRPLAIRTREFILCEGIRKNRRGEGNAADELKTARLPYNVDDDVSRLTRQRLFPWPPVDEDDVRVAGLQRAKGPAPRSRRAGHWGAAMVTSVHDRDDVEALACRWIDRPCVAGRGISAKVTLRLWPGARRRASCAPAGGASSESVAAQRRARAKFFIGRFLRWRLW